MSQPSVGSDPAGSRVVLREAVKLKERELTAIVRAHKAVRRGIASARLRRLIPEPNGPGGPSLAVVVRALVTQLRVVQWVKNLACLAGLVFSGRLFLFQHQSQAVLGFWCFCFASSAVYILNDFLDREKDRLN